MKKNLFSQILSIGLALCMVMALLPATAVTAAAADTTAGYTIVYDFIENYQEGICPVGTTQIYAPTKNLVDTYEKSNGFWKFVPNDKSLYIDHQYTGNVNEWNNGLLSYFSSGASSWYAIKVRVPVAGNYNMIMDYKRNTSYESALGVYVLDGTATSEDIDNSISSQTGKVGTVDFTAGQWIIPQEVSVGNVTLSAGEHIVVFHSPNKKDVTIRGLILKSGDGSLKAPMSATATANKTTLDPSISGDNAAISISSVMYSDTTTATSGIPADSFAYISRDESRATVSANGVVTVNPDAADGEVSVDVVLKENNSLILDTVVFSVAASECSDVKFVYDFKSNYSADVPSTESGKSFFTASANLVDTYDKTNGFWKFALCDGSVWVNREYSESNHANDGFLVYWGGEWFAIKIRVPVSDIYKTSVGYNANNSFEKNLEVYLLDGNADNAAVAESIANGTNKLGTVDCTVGKYDGTQKKELASKKLSAGEYLVVFRSPTKTYLRLYEFALTAGDGTKTVPMSLTAGVSKETLDASVAGDNAGVSISSVMYSDANAKTSGFSNNEFVFTSSDTTRATVDANGKVTVANGAKEGNVSITIASKSAPTVTLGSVTLNVVERTSANINIVYDFIDNYSDDVPYTVSENNFYTYRGVNEVGSYAKANGFWKFAAMEGLLSVNHQYNATSAYANGLMAYFAADSSWYAIKVRVPQADVYSASIGTIATSGHETNLEVYILDGDSDASAIAESIANGTGKLGAVDCTRGGYSALDSERRTLGNVELSAGEHIVVFHAANGKNAKIWSFVLKGGDGSKTVPMGAKLSLAEIIEKGDGTVVSVEKVFMSDATDVASVDGITFESSDTGVVSVSGKTVRGVSVGDAKILAKYNGYTIGEADIKVTEAELSETVSFATTSNCGAEITVSGISYNGAVDSVAPGSLVTVTAPEVEGYKFRYWKSGYQNGRYLSDESEYSFRLVTHTFLTAVYDAENTDSISIDFFNGNGAFIESVGVVKGAIFGANKIANPALTGFDFIGWSLEDSEVINENTRAVALYNETGKSVSGAVKVNGTPVENPTYDAKVVSTSAGATHWLRDGKVVAYGENYTHYIWDATDITSSTAAIVKAPVVVLEDTTVDGAYMIEYDAAGYEIVEAGIVFGSSDATVGSCTSKATSQKNANHGQFTAKPSGSESAARGYIIYKDGNVNRVIYSK